MCLCEEESNPHLFIHCNMAHNLWGQMLQLFGVQWGTPPMVKDLISADHASHWSKAGRILWRAVVVAIVWVIWIERNSRLFQGLTTQGPTLFHKVTSLVTLWDSNQRIFAGFPPNTFLSQWEKILYHRPRKAQRSHNWQPPPEQVIKLNFDGCSLGNPGNCGCWWCLQRPTSQ
ncbi:hypothetical protein AMTRI_Chr13g117720 [Amborella trichopoda]